MNLHISGKGIHIGENLSKHIHESIESHIKKYFDNPLSARVTVCKESYLFRVDIVVNDGIAGAECIKVSGLNHDPYVAADIAISHLSSKLRKYKKRIKNHKHGAVFKIKSHLYQHQDSDEQLPHVGDGASFSKVEEQVVNLRTLSIEDALMHLDLMSVPALLFVNIETNNVNMVYIKEDGKIMVLDIHKDAKEQQS